MSEQKKTYRVENVYRVWDCINGGSVTIQEGDDAGLIDIDNVTVTVEQVPGIIRVLEQLKQNHDLDLEKQIQKVPIVENSRSGRSDPPF